MCDSRREKGHDDFTIHVNCRNDGGDEEMARPSRSNNGNDIVEVNDYHRAATKMNTKAKKDETQGDVRKTLCGNQSSHCTTQNQQQQQQQQQDDNHSNSKSFGIENILSNSYNVRFDAQLGEKIDQQQQLSDIIAPALSPTFIKSPAVNIIKDTEEKIERLRESLKTHDAYPARNQQSLNVVNQMVDLTVRLNSLISENVLMQETLVSHANYPQASDSSWGIVPTASLSTTNAITSHNLNSNTETTLRSNYESSMYCNQHRLWILINLSKDFNAIKTEGEHVKWNKKLFETKETLGHFHSLMKPTLYYDHTLTRGDVREPSPSNQASQHITQNPRDGMKSISRYTTSVQTELVPPQNHIARFSSNMERARDAFVKYLYKARNDKSITSASVLDENAPPTATNTPQAFVHVPNKRRHRRISQSAPSLPICNLYGAFNLAPPHTRYEPQSQPRDVIGNAVQSNAFASRTAFFGHTNSEDSSLMPLDLSMKRQDRVRRDRAFSADQCNSVAAGQKRSTPRWNYDYDEAPGVSATKQLKNDRKSWRWY